MKIGVFGYIGIGLFVVGMVLLVFAIREYREDQVRIRGATEVESKVTELVREPNDDWSDCRNIRMEFIWKGEKKFYLDGPHCPPDYSVGEAVLLLYIPGKPSKVFVNDFSHRWVTVTVLIVPGVFLIFMGLVFFFMAGIEKR